MVPRTPTGEKKYLVLVLDHLRRAHYYIQYPMYAISIICVVEIG